MVKLPTKFEVSTLTRYGDMKGIKNGVVRGHSRSSAMSPFDTAHMISHSSVIETMRLPFILYGFYDTASYLLKFANFNLPHQYLAPLLRVTPFEDFWLQKTRVPGLSCGVVCVILRFRRFSRTPTCDR